MKKEEREVELLDKLVQRVGSLKPSQFDYVERKDGNGTAYTYITSQGDFKIMLAGWNDWSSFESAKSPSSYEIKVLDKKSEEWIFHYKSKYGGKISENQVGEERAQAVEKLYQKIRKSVDRSRTQKKVRERKAALKRLEEALE